MKNNVELEVVVSIPMEDIVDNLTYSNTQYLIDFLEKNKKIEEQVKKPALSIIEEEFNKSVDLLRKSYYLLNKEDINTIINLASKL